MRFCVLLMKAVIKINEREDKRRKKKVNGAGGIVVLDSVLIVCLITAVALILFSVAAYVIFQRKKSIQRQSRTMEFTEDDREAALLIGELADIVNTVEKRLDMEEVLEDKGKS